MILKTSKGKIQEKQILRPTTKENIVRILLQTLVQIRNGASFRRETMERFWDHRQLVNLSCLGTIPGYWCTTRSPPVQTHTSLPPLDSNVLLMSGHTPPAIIPLQLHSAQLHIFSCFRVRNATSLSAPEDGQLPYYGMRKMTAKYFMLRRDENHGNALHWSIWWRRHHSEGRCSYQFLLQTLVYLFCTLLMAVVHFLYRYLHLSALW